MSEKKVLKSKASKERSRFTEGKPCAVDITKIKLVNKPKK